jgi:hypothetical protein
MANDPNSTNTRWLTFHQTLAWFRQRYPGATDKQAWDRLQQALILEWASASESVPIDKFRYPWAGRMSDLVVLLRNKHLTFEDIRWQNVECNLDWLERDWPLPALEAEAALTPAADAALRKLNRNQRRCRLLRPGLRPSLRQPHLLSRRTSRRSLRPHLQSHYMLNRHHQSCRHRNRRQKEQDNRRSHDYLQRNG